MIRSLLRITLYVVLLSLAHPAHAAQAVLKSAIVVEGEKVTLGDLFDASAFAAAPESAHVAVLAAPRPGESFNLDALALVRFAARHKIDWLNTQGLTAIRIERAGTLVGADAIEKTLREGIEARGMQGRVGIRLSGAPPTLYVATGTAPSVSLETLSVDPGTGHFTATLRAPAADPAGASLRVTGRAYAIAELPVLSRDIKPGETIGASDVVFTETPREKLGQNVLTAADDLIGKAAKRMIRAGRALRLGDVEPPVLVKKNAVVTMTMTMPGMSLTAEGRALEDGAAGDAIKIMNTASKRTVVATVQTEGLVSVGRSPSPLAANYSN